MPPEADAMERFGGWRNVCRGRLAGDPNGEAAAGHTEPPLSSERHHIQIVYLCNYPGFLAILW